MLSKQSVGKTLKERRKATLLTVENVSVYLSSKGYRASMKAVYSWENGNTLPPLDIFLELCGMYGIIDISEVFDIDYSEFNFCQRIKRTIYADVIE